MTDNTRHSSHDTTQPRYDSRNQDTTDKTRQDDNNQDTKVNPRQTRQQRSHRIARRAAAFSFPLPSGLLPLSSSTATASVVLLAEQAPAGERQMVYGLSYEAKRQHANWRWGSRINRTNIWCIRVRSRVCVCACVCGRVRVKAVSLPPKLAKLSEHI